MSRPATPKPPRVLRPHHERLLAAIGRYYASHGQQLHRRLYYGSRATHRIYGLITDLESFGLIEKIDVPQEARGGGLYKALELTGEGRKVLKQLGYPIPDRVRRNEGMKTRDHFMHTFAVNEVLIAAELLAEQQPGIRLLRMIHEKEIKHRYRLSVEIANLTRYQMELDGFLAFGITTDDGERSVSFGLEVDRDTITTDEKVKKKVIALTLAKLRGEYQALFGVDEMRILYSCPTKKRRKQLMDWTADALASIEATAQDAACFLFVDTMPQNQTPQDFWLPPVAHSLVQEEPFPLLSAPIQPRTPQRHMLAGTIFD